MAAVAAMVPVSATVSERILPTPSVVSPLAELRMELPPVTAAGDAALPIVPESGGSASVAALAAMASVVRTMAVDRPLAAPAAITPTADLPMTLMPAATTLATQAVAPVVPESDRSNGMSTQVVAAIVPLAAADQAHTLAQIPATPTRVAELSMQVLSHGIDANTLSYRNSRQDRRTRPRTRLPRSHRSLALPHTTVSCPPRQSRHTSWSCRFSFAIGGSSSRRPRSRGDIAERVATRCLHVAAIS